MTMKPDYFVRVVTLIMVFVLSRLNHRKQDSLARVLMIALLQTQLMGNVYAHLMRSIQVTVISLKGIFSGDKSLKISRHIGMRLNIYAMLLLDGMNVVTKVLNTINGNVRIIKHITM